MSPRLTVAMIVKDEAELLPRFLQAAKGLADELLVVDTGSQDATVALLERAGARVLHRPWDGDFSAARNFGLEHATGDWVLFLDADEFVHPELHAQVRALMEDASAGAATVVMHNEMPHGHSRQSRLLRLFRNAPGVRFRHRIHEEISSAVEQHLLRAGKRLVHLSAGVDHVGYVRARASAKDKKARDLRLLEQCLAADPADLYSHFKRLELARFWSDPALWKRAAHDALPALSGALPETLIAAPFAGELAVLVADGLHRAPAEALAFLQSQASRLRPSAALFLRRAELCELLGKSEEAAADFERCLQLQSDLGSLQLSTVRPLLGLARLALERGDLPSARARAEEALGHNGRDPEALLAAATLERATAGLAGLERWVEASRARRGDSAELTAAAVEASLRAGDYEWAWTTAQPHRDSPVVEELLAQAALGLGDVEKARACAEHAFQASPSAGVGVLVCDLAQGRNSDLELPFEQEEVSALLRRWLEPIAHGRSALLRRLIAQVTPALQESFPWLPAYTARWV